MCILKTQFLFVTFSFSNVLKGGFPEAKNRRGQCPRRLRIQLIRSHRLLRGEAAIAGLIAIHEGRVNGEALEGQIRLIAA